MKLFVKTPHRETQQTQRKWPITIVLVIIKPNMDRTFINSLNKLAATINKSLSKGIISMLHQDQPQEEHEVGPKIYALGSDLR